MKIKAIVTAVAATALGTTAFAAGSMNDQVNQGGGIVNVRIDAAYSAQMLDNQTLTGNAVNILKSRASGDLAPNAIYIGGKGELYFSYAHAGSLPSASAAIYGQNAGTGGSYVGSKTIGSGAVAGSAKNGSTTAINLPYADVAFTSTIGKWVTGFADFQVNNQSTSDVVMPNAYFMVGNLTESPFYFVGGKKVVDFGNFDSVTNFMPTLTRAYFMEYGGQVAVGFSKNGLNLTASLLDGKGASNLNSYSSSDNQVNDFALNALYNGMFGNIGYHAGAGYTNATGFLNDSGNMIGAFDLNAGVKFQGLSVNGEFLMTAGGVHSMATNSAYSNSVNYATTGNNASLGLNDSAGWRAFGFNALAALIPFGDQNAADYNGSSSSSVKAWSLDGSYTLPVAGKDMVPYLSYSQASQDSDNDIYQFEVGTRYNIIDTIWLGAAYNYTSGKSAGTSIGKFNSVLVDATAYF
ncbi:MAG: hypothetical protein ACO2ZM_02095 [Francisellaceae bacterium]